MSTTAKVGCGFTKVMTIIDDWFDSCYRRLMNLTSLGGDYSSHRDKVERFDNPYRAIGSEYPPQPHVELVRDVDNLWARADRIIQSPTHVGDLEKSTDHVRGYAEPPVSDKDEKIIYHSRGSVSREVWQHFPEGPHLDKDLFIQGAEEDKIADPHGVYLSEIGGMYWTA